MRTLITGISGFVGRALSRHLLDQGASVAGTFSSRQPEVGGAELFQADLLDPDSVRRVVEQVRPDAIVHLAGLGHVGDSWKRMGEYYRVNVLGTETLLRAAAGIRVVLASSAEVYGGVPLDEQPISEDRDPAPANPYGLTKAAAERHALREGGIVARSFNLSGLGQSARYALPSFARQLAAVHSGAQAPVLRVGNLAARRDFLHVDDGAEAFRTLVEHGESGVVYNLGSGRAWSIQEVLDRLIALSGVEVVVEVDPQLFRPVDVELLQADFSRLRALGWEPRRHLDDILRDLWASAVDSAAEEPAVHLSSP